MLVRFLGAVCANIDAVIGIENAAVAFGGDALSVNAPAAPRKFPVSVGTIARERVPVMVVPLVVTFETVIAPPDNWPAVPLVVEKERPWF